MKNNKYVVDHQCAERFWKFIPNNKRLSYGDDRKIVTGKVYELNSFDQRMMGPEVCLRGFHACRRLKDVLHFRDVDATGFFQRDLLCVVELFGIMQDSRIGTVEKTVASHMKVVSIHDVSSIQSRRFYNSPTPRERSERLKACRKLARFLYPDKLLVSEAPDDLEKYLL